MNNINEWLNDKADARRNEEAIISELAFELLDCFPNPNDEQIMDWATLANVNPDGLKDTVEMIKNEGK